MTIEINETLFTVVGLLAAGITFIVALRYQVNGTKVSINDLRDKVDEEVSRSTVQLEKIVAQMQKFVNDIREIERHFTTLLDTKTADERYVNKEAFEAYHQSFTTSIDRLNEAITSLQNTILEMRHER